MVPSALREEAVAGAVLSEAGETEMPNFGARSTRDDDSRDISVASAGVDLWR